MKKYLILLVLFVFLLATASCGSDRFTITGKLEDAGTQNLRFVYYSGNSVRADWIPSVDGAFSMQGNAEELTVVYVYSSQMKFITHVAVKNGEEIELSGSIKDNYEIIAKGTETAEEWNAFVRSHAAAFRSMDFAKTDKAISDFVKANPENAVSTLLLTCDYSAIETEEAKTLLDGIGEKAKPASLLALYGYALQEEAQKTKRLMAFSLHNDKDSLELVSVRDAKVSLFYFWKEYGAERDSVVKRLKRLSDAHKTGKKQFQVADVFMDYDTAAWRGTMLQDSASWKHFKARMGAVDKTVASLGIRGMNYFIVTDSAGVQLYRGTSVEKAEDAVEESLKK